jgi:hypothetical protein
VKAVKKIEADGLMTNQWTELPDDKLAAMAQEGLQGQGAHVEAMRRLRVSIERAGERSDRYSRLMLWLTIILAILTFVQVIAVLPTIKAWLSF